MEPSENSIPSINCKSNFIKFFIFTVLTLCIYQKTHGAKSHTLSYNNAFPACKAQEKKNFNLQPHRLKKSEGNSDYAGSSF